ncbi:TPA: YlmH/Sll1252 family protein [Streptococcus pneumoniae]
MNKGIYQHFSIEDRPFLDKGMEWIKKVEDSYAPFLTPFINPHQEKLLKILAKTYGLACSSSGEFVSSEYVRVLLYPDYFQPEFSDFEISLQEIVYSNKFEHLTHAKILGTVINQLGIERKLFGDILVDEERAQIMINQQFLLPRNQANQLIEKKLVQVNYHVVDKSDYTVQVGDLISVRKFGRLRLLQDKGQTKKEKKKITVQLLLSK